MGGYVGSIIFGTILGFLGSIALWMGDAGTFALIYVIGELCLLIGSMFLAKPHKQCQSMWSSLDHAVASAVWLGCLVVILIVAFTVGSDEDNGGAIILILMLVVIEKAAYIWYTLAFFPGGHTAAKLMLKTFCCPGSE